MTWAEVCTHLEAKGTLERKTGEAAKLTVPVTPTPWAIELRTVSVAGETWLEFTSTIGEARFASPQAMLADTAELAIGGLAVSRDGSIVIRQVLPLDGMRLHDLDETVLAVATQAAKAAAGLKKHMSPTG